MPARDCRARIRPARYRRSLAALPVRVSCSRWPSLATPAPRMVTNPRLARPGIKWDVAFVAAYLGVRPEIELPDRYADRWYNAGQAGVIVGPLLHATSEGRSRAVDQHRRSTVDHSVSSPRFLACRIPMPYVTERFATLRRDLGALVWQFFDNEWVHPFVGAGRRGRLRARSVVHARQNLLCRRSAAPEFAGAS